MLRIEKLKSVKNVKGLAKDGLKFAGSVAVAIAVVEFAYDANEKYHKALVIQTLKAFGLGGLRGAVKVVTDTADALTFGVSTAINKKTDNNVAKARADSEKNIFPRVNVVADKPQFIFSYSFECFFKLDYNKQII